MWVQSKLRKVSFHLLGSPNSSNSNRLRELAEPWRPYRGAAAVLAWHHYNSDVL